MKPPKCDRCKKPLQKLGGLAFSPPVKREPSLPGYEVAKYHLCTGCWQEFMEWIMTPLRVAQFLKRK